MLDDEQGVGIICIQYFELYLFTTPAAGDLMNLFNRKQIKPRLPQDPLWNGSI